MFITGIRGVHIFKISRSDHQILGPRNLTRRELTVRIHRSGVSCEPRCYLAFSRVLYMKFYSVLYVKEKTAMIMLKILVAMGQNLVTRFLHPWLEYRTGLVILECRVIFMLIVWIWIISQFNSFAGVVSWQELDVSSSWLVVQMSRKNIDFNLITNEYLRDCSILTATTMNSMPAVVCIRCGKDKYG